MCQVGPKGRRIHICQPEKRRTNFYWTSVAKGDGPSGGIMFVSDDEVTALRAELERAKKEFGKNTEGRGSHEAEKGVREASERTVVGHILRQARR